MDPLSDVLALLRLRSYGARAFSGGGELSLSFTAHAGMKLCALVSGDCWLSVSGVAEPIHMREGDCLLLPTGQAFVAATDLALEPVDAATIFAASNDSGPITYQGGGHLIAIIGHFALATEHAALLRGALPPVIHIREDADKAMLRWCLERMTLELTMVQPGSVLVAQQLATMMLVQVLRLHMVAAGTEATGWLAALTDQRLAPAICAMYERPDKRWTVEALAKRAGMSRTSFAVRFKQVAGASPMDYLTCWRMLLAADRLKNSGDPVSAIALSLGYESESAFSAAFKRVMGRSPRQYGRNQATPPRRR